ncbi:MAG: glycosyltransferase family 39 protein [Acidimicrobiia bacterium]
MNGNPLPSKPGWRSLEPTKLAVAAFAFIGLLLRGALVSRSLRAIDGLFIPDDTYYTLTIARSLAHGHGPTVDGSTLTSGFQPLLGFLMTPVFWFTSSSDTALRLDLVLLVIADTATILVIAWVAHRLAGRVAAVAAAAMWALSPIAISMALGGLETSLAILAQVGLVAVWIRARERDDTRHWIVVGVVAGLAVLARIDSLALVALLGALQLWRGTRPGLRPAAIAGAIVLAPWFGWCAVTFGTPIPTSGTSIRQLAPYGAFSRQSTSIAASAVAGSPFGAWTWARTQLVTDWSLGMVVFWVLVAAFVALVVICLRVSLRNPDRASWTLVPALPAFAAVLLVFYAWFGVTWYFTRYLAPVAWIVTVMIAAAIGALIRAGDPAPTRRRGAVLPAIGIVIVSLLLVAAMRTDLKTMTKQYLPVATTGTAGAYDSATGFRDPVQTVLAQVPEGSRIAGWQSGALGYYGSNRVVINLDGVVNPDTAGKDVSALARYLRKRRVEGIVDVPLVIARMDVALRNLQPPAHTEPVVTVPGNGILQYQYVRIVWPPRG